MSNVSDAASPDGAAEPELVQECPDRAELDARLHDIEHLGEDIKNTISSAGLSGPTFVDNLFRTFLAKKMEDIEGEHKKRKKKKKSSKDDTDASKSRKHKSKKKHKSKSKHKKSRSRVSSDCDKTVKSDHRSDGESDSGSKLDRGSNSGDKSSQHSKLDRGSERSHHGSKADHGSEDDHYRSNAGVECDHTQDTENHRLNEFVDHKGKLMIDSSNADIIGSSLRTEITESDRPFDYKIEPDVNIASISEHRIETIEDAEEVVNIKSSSDDLKDDEEGRICGYDVVDRNFKPDRDVNSPPSPSSFSGSHKISKHSSVSKELHAPYSDLYPVKHPVDLEAGISQSIGVALEADKKLYSSPDRDKEKVNGDSVENETEAPSCDNGSGNRGSATVVVLGDKSKESDGKPLSSHGSGRISADHSKEPEKSKGHHDRKSKDCDRHSGGTIEDPSVRSSERSDKTSRCKSSLEKKRDRSGTLDCGKESKDHGDREKDDGNRSKNHSKDHGIRSKDREKSSKDRDHEKRSKDHDSESRNRSNHPEDHRGRSKDRDSRSRDCRQQSRIFDDLPKDHDNQIKADQASSRDHVSPSENHGGSKGRESQSKDRGQHSNDLDSRSKDRGQRSGDRDTRSKDHRQLSRDRDSRSKDREKLSRERDSKSKDHDKQLRGHSQLKGNGQQSRDRSGSRSKDRGQRSRDRDSRSKDCGQQSRDSESHSKDHGKKPKDCESQAKDRGQQSRGNDTQSKDKNNSSSEKRRDRSRSTDRRRLSTDRDSRSRDRRRQSKDRDHSRTKRSSPDRKKDRSRSIEFQKRSKDRSKSEDRSKGKKSRDDGVSGGDSGDTRPLRRLQSKKQKHKKRRERSVEIIEDDDDTESPEASEKLTEQLLKRLNTSIRRGQELREEKDALLDPGMLSEAGPEDLAELYCVEEERKEHVVEPEDAAVSGSGATCEGVSSVAVSNLVVSDVGVSAASGVGVASVDVPAPVQGPAAEAGGRAAASMTKVSLGKAKKPLMTMGIRLTENSMAIISSGVMVETEHRVNAEEVGESRVKTGGSADQPLADVLPRDPPSGCLPQRIDTSPIAETVSKPDVDKTAIKGDSKRDSHGIRSSDQKETNSKSESRKRRCSRSRERATKKRKDNKSRDLSPVKSSESKTKDVNRKSKSRSPSRRSRSRSKKRRNRSRSRSKDRRRKSRSRSNDQRRKSRERRRRSRSQSKDRRQSRKRDRSRSAALEKSQEDLRLKIDKARLREIAIKKVYGNAQKGATAPAFDMKPEEVVAFRSGGKSVEELTDFCKRIAEKERNQAAKSPSPVEERPASEDEDMPFTTNAFKAREVTNSIILNIRNSKPLPVFSSQEKIAKAAELRTQFPVSSGTQHRAKEWVPVEKTQQPGVSGSSTGNPPLPGAVEPAASEDKVFPDPPAQQIDVGQVVSKRLSALRKLQSNPNDVQALGSVFKAQQEMQQWAASKQLPGQFMGSTGLSVLPQRDIFNHNPRNQAWVKKDCSPLVTTGT